jgi:hypothetical protein
MLSQLSTSLPAISDVVVDAEARREIVYTEWNEESRALILPSFLFLPSFQ